MESLTDENGKNSDVCPFLKFEPIRLPTNSGAESAPASAQISVPAGFGRTGAVIIKVEPTQLDASERFWLRKIEIQDGADMDHVVALAETWIQRQQGWRTVFANNKVCQRLSCFHLSSYAHP